MIMLVSEVRGFPEIPREFKILKSQSVTLNEEF